MGLSPNELIYKIIHLPKGTNPYLWLSNFMHTQYLPHYSSSTRIQLYLNIAMIEVCLCLLLASLYLRYRKNHFWFFRKQLGGLLIQPNIATVGGLLGLVFMVLTNIWAFAIVEAANGKLPPNLGFLTLLNTVFPGLVGEVAIWSMASSYLCHLHSTQSTTTQGTTRNLRPWAIASNILGIATPLVHLAVFLPFDVIAGRRYGRVVTLYRQLDDALLLQADQWGPDSMFILTDLLPFEPFFTKLQTEILALEPVLRTVYIFHAVTMVLIILIVAIIASFYLSSVKRLIRTAKQNLLISERGTELLDQVYQTWCGLVLAITLIDLTASSYFAFVLYSAIHPLEASQTFVVAVFWTNSILGLVSTGLMFWLAKVLKPISKDEVNDENREGRVGEPLRLPRVRHRMSLQWRSEQSRGVVHSTTTRDRSEEEEQIPRPEMLQVLTGLPLTPSTDQSSSDSRLEKGSDEEEVLYEVRLRDY